MHAVEDLGVQVLYKSDGQLMVGESPDLQLVLWMLMYADDVPLICDCERDLVLALFLPFSSSGEWMPAYQRQKI